LRRWPLIALNWFGVNLDPADVRIAALTVTASRRQIDKADLVDLAEIHFVQQDTFSLNLLDVELQPSNITKVELALTKIERVSIRMIAHEECSVGQLQDGTNLVKT